MERRWLSRFPPLRLRVPVSGTPIDFFGDPGRIWTIPPEDVCRQATASLRGYVYQLHASAAAWVDLGTDDQLYLEVAEDYAEVLREPCAVDDVLRATQVKDTRETGSVTLNSPDVLDAIEALYRLRVSNPGRQVRLVFLTTSEIGRERRDALPSGVAGLAAWNAAASGESIDEIRAALLQRTLSDGLKAWVAHSSPGQLRTELFGSLTFACGAQDWRSLEASNRRALVALRNEVQATADMAHRAYDAVFRDVVACALGPAPRRLDRAQLRACLERATTIAVPSAVAGRLLGQSAARPSGPVPLEDLRALAEALIDAGAPPSVNLLFPDATAEARAALKRALSAEPRLTEAEPAGSPASATVTGLINRPEQKHLVIGQPGSGKTYTLWHAAKGLLAAETVVPLFLPAGQARNWRELEEMIEETAPGISSSAALQDARVCVLVDGWSEFAMETRTGEKRRALRVLRGTRLVATAKFADVDDVALKRWTLDLLPPDRVARAVATAAPGDPPPPGPVLDLLRLPLLLAIHVLSGARAAATGDLLRQFHEHLARGLPERFTEALAGAVADLSLAGTRSFGRLVYELQARTAPAGLTDPVGMLRSLGTILERGGQAVPVHDLYWSWLAGRGLLDGGGVQRAVGLLQTRESYALAIQAGARATEGDVKATAREDLVLAAALEASRGTERPAPALTDAVACALADPRLAVRNRAALAALEAGRPELLRPALDVLTELHGAGLYPPEWRQALRPATLYGQRRAVAEWLGSPGTGLVLDVIAERGGPEWSPWLEQVAASGRIDWANASAAALGCCRDVPSWVWPHLDTIIASRSWKLRPAADRRVNGALARFVAGEYERLVDTVIPSNSSGWLDLNRVLVGCGDEDVFRLLLDRFASMGARAQELLGFAVVERGSPWVARFQRVALATGGRHHHRLAEQLSLDIDDATARGWIAAGHDEAGWRVLIARHGEAVLPELIAQLPESFAGLHHIPALAHMRWLPSAPETLIDEVWGRLGSPMQPKAMQDVLNAVARVYPVGVPHIVRFIAEQPDALPAFHLRQALLLYEDWRKKIGVGMGVRVAGGVEQPFPEWIALRSAQKRWEEYFTPELLALSPELATDYVVQQLADDDERAAAVIKALGSLATYSARLLDRMLARPALAVLVPDVFADAFDLFPVEAIRRCMASPEIDQNMLLFRLAATANPMHRAVHEDLIRRVLDGSPNLHHLGYIASMLKAYPRDEVLDLLNTAPHLREDQWFWFVRAVEVARGERLINEAGAARR